MLRTEKTFVYGGSALLFVLFLCALSSFHIANLPSYCLQYLFIFFTFCLAIAFVSLFASCNSINVKSNHNNTFSKKIINFSTDAIQNKNTLCCIIMHSFGGGGEKMALLLAAQLIESGHDVVIASLYYLPELRSNLPKGVQFSMPERDGKWSMFLHLLSIRKIVLLLAVLNCKVFLLPHCLPLGRLSAGFTKIWEGILKNVALYISIFIVFYSHGVLADAEQ